MRPFDKQHTQKTRLHLADKHGIETTPDELEKIGKDAMNRIRKDLEAKGYKLPESDEELFVLVHRALKEP